MVMAANATIKAIEPSTIQSGQVIVDLCSVAKELVENSLDAGATSIDVRFKNQGLDSIEVQDNGYGISPQNYETLALKHYTSKLSTYADLTTLQTFGFRGEALSSLCALSHFSVVTCTQDEAPKAKKLEFEPSGKLKNTSVVSGHKGTTINVENLFHNLPVRRRELERNIKREWGKVINLLNQYACVQTGVKFSVSQQPTKGKRMLLFSTKGNTTTRDNIINVFGVKSTAGLITLDLTLELTPTHNPLHKRNANGDDGTREVHVKGHVSRPTHGEGRQTPDRQMFYVNGRPCGLPQFAKVFNEVYRSYNASQSPFIFADIQLDTHLYDVNVSPDKRTILLHDQGQMLDNLRESLIELFEKQDITVPSSQLLTGKQTPFKKPSFIRRETPGSERSESTRASPFQQQPSTAKSEERHLSDEDDEGTDDDQESQSLRMSVTNRNAKRASALRSSRGAETVQKLGRQITAGQQSIFAAFRRSVASERPLQNKPASSADEDEEEEEDDEEEDEEEGQEAADHGEQGEAKDKPSSNPSDEDADVIGEQAPKSSAQHLAEHPTLDQDVEPNESSIPAVIQLSQPRPTLPSSTRSPRRPGPQVAVIRIGDEEVSGVIGEPQKRPRADSASASASPARKRVAKTSVPLPSFGGRLSQMFAAGGASQRVPQEDEEVDKDHGSEENDDVEDLDARAEEPEAGEEADGDDSLFVSQDGERSPPPENDAGDSDLSAINATEHNQSDQASEHGVAEDNEDSEEEDHMSAAGSEGSHQSRGDADYVEQDQVAAEEDAEAAAPLEPSEESLKRQGMLLKGSSARRRDTTTHYLQELRTSESSIRQHLQALQSSLSPFSSASAQDSDSTNLDTADAEEKLSLKISKSDFAQMKIVGQFNLGFIIAVREAAAAALPNSTAEVQEHPQDDEVFIIDQHASDEKFNFERLQATTVVQSQRLVQPKVLELTAMEEEILMENVPALETNGFLIRVDDSRPVGERIQLLSLPLSHETTFSLADLEELIFLLGEDGATGAATTAVPRPSKVRKMFAMRACRSSIMIGKALSGKKMREVVRHMGEMEKPWNCPHGRPTMRHLCGLGVWDGRGWKEGEDTEESDWGGWLAGR